MADDILKPIPEKAAFSVLTDQFRIQGMEGAHWNRSINNTEGLIPLCRHLIDYISRHCQNGERFAETALLTAEVDKPDKDHWARANTEYAHLLARSHGLADTPTAGRGYVGHIHWTRPTGKRVVFYGAGIFGSHDDAGDLHTPRAEDFATSSDGVRRLLDLGFRQYLLGVRSQNPESRILKGARIYADTLLFGVQIPKSNDYINGLALSLRVNHHGMIRSSLEAVSYHNPDKGSAAQSVGIGEGYPAFSTSTLGQSRRADARHFRRNHLRLLPKEMTDEQLSNKRDQIAQTRGYISSQVPRLFEAFLDQAFRSSEFDWSRIVFEPTLTVTVARQGKENQNFTQKGDSLSDDLFGLRNTPVIKVAGGLDLDESGWRGFVETARGAFGDRLPQLEPHPLEAITEFGPGDAPVMCISRCPGEADNTDAEGSVHATIPPGKSDEASTQQWLGGFEQALGVRSKNPEAIFDPYTQKRLQLYDSEFDRWHPAQNINDTNLTNSHAVRRSFVELSLKNALAGDARTLVVSGLPPEMEGSYMGLYGRFPRHHTSEARATAMIIKVAPYVDDQGHSPEGVMGVTIERIETQRLRLPVGPGVTTSDREAYKQKALRDAVKKTGYIRQAARLDQVLARERGQADRVSVFDDDPFLIDLERSEIMRCVASADNFIPALIQSPGSDLSDLDKAMREGAFSKSSGKSAFPHLNMSTTTPVAVDTSHGPFARVAYGRKFPPGYIVARNTRLRDYQVFNMSDPGNAIESPEQSRVFALNMRLLTNDYLKAGQTSATSVLEKLMRLVVVN